MVAGRVKAAMGFQRSPATPRPSYSSSSARKAQAPAPLQLPGSAASGAGQPETPRRRSSGSPAPSGSGSKAGPFSRYFPRSSAQVQPARAASEPAELVRLVEELQERESRLRTELLEHKILKETVAIVPFLETELAAKSSELGRCRDALSRLEAENARLRAELDAAVAAARSNEQRVLEMEKELAERDLVTVDLKQQQQRRRRTSGSTATTSTCDEEDLQSVLPCDFSVDSGARSMREASPRGGGVLPLANAERLEVEGRRRNR
ncbi:hypothetical protein C2845_PM06G02910 [Panicum miliaceum]|uniref:Uncharacterized protein n=1 Tax=Panicum miliaceum TaxID=4540 RepID=A0A3L6RD71_PANMI|nr:hypothetical protein C2845_PM06G02910 [Panicum miliaceum]